jgi:hypothetical protein
MVPAGLPAASAISVPAARSAPSRHAAQRGSPGHAWSTAAARESMWKKPTSCESNCSNPAVSSVAWTAQERTSGRAVRSVACHRAPAQNPAIQSRE